ncbi:hypothetical protein LMH71_19785 [Enterovibrio norvegicus]|nr:hypothetical protein [Enterovibrio norvegicus]
MAIRNTSIADAIAIMVKRWQRKNPILTGWRSDDTDPIVNPFYLFALLNYFIDIKVEMITTRRESHSTEKRHLFSAYTNVKKK